ncbi:MAG: PAS domain S-box protein [Candidatus Lokiarchaeota archaeon]|nr:PAS domain S-box protein [Candidatus Lokiarchaeota archaeon]
MSDKNDYKQSEEILRVIQEQTIMGIHIIQDNKIIYMNNTYEDLSGYSFEEIKNWDINQIMAPVHPDDRAFVLEQLQKKQRGDPDAVINYQFRTITKSGDEKWIDLYSKTITFGDKPADLLTFIDITEKMKAQKEMQETVYLYNRMSRQFKTLLDSTNDLVFLIDDKLRFILANKNCNIYFDKPSHEIVGKKITSCFSGFKNSKFYGLLKNTLKNDEIGTVIDKIILPNGKTLYFNARVFPIEQGLFWILRDVSKEKQYEEQLIESEAKYKEAFKLVTFFNNLFAHDMSNILQSIKSSIEYFGLFRNDPEKMGEFGDIVDIVKKHTDRGKKLIANVRKLSSLNDSMINVVPVNVSNVLKEAIDHLKTGFQERVINIDIEGLRNDFKVQANELLIDVFDNILNNAVKYTDPEKDVNISILISTIKQKSVPIVRFEFKDFGMGIADAKKKILFKKLYSENLSERGMGMGLSLVKKIVDGYGGSISVKDRIQGDHTKGTNFVLDLLGVNKDRS